MDPEIFWIIQIRRVASSLAHFALCGGILLAGLIGTAQSGVPEAQIPTVPPGDSLPDSSDLIAWPVKGYPVFDPASVVNTGAWLFDAPAGKHGFVEAQPDGQLAFADRTPVRFWGTTLVFGATFPDKPEEIATLVDAIAASGYNLVRFHHNDTPGNGLGYLQENPKSNSLLEPQMMDRLDRMAAELFKRGIYVYFDFCDSRPLLSEDGIDDLRGATDFKDGGWKGLFPHPKIVEAWKRAVTSLLTHKNPYTGRTWGEEPGVASIEIINENGLFWDWSFKINPAIQKWHDVQWNQWLLKKYGTRENLDKQWTDQDDAKGLYEAEDPAQGTVFAPPMGPLLEWDRPYHSKTRGAARVNDFYAFLAESATAFYRDASKHIRSYGFKGVIVGSHELEGPINQYAEVQGTGAIAAHLYATGLPAWNARPTVRGQVTEGVDVKTRNWFSNIPRVKIQGAPGINGEWTGGTQMYRADVNVAVAAITSFQRLTESLHFAYAQRWTRVPMPDYNAIFSFLAYENKIGLAYTSLHDEPWMMVNRICSPIFIRRDFAAAHTKAEIGFSAEDRFEQNLHALGRSGGSATIGDAATFLPILHDVECTFFDTVYQGDADVVFMTGRTASGDYSHAKHAVIVGDNPWCDRYHKHRDLGAPARFVNPGVKIDNLKTPTTFTVSWPYDKERALSFDALEGVVELGSIPPGAQPIGKSADGKYTLGWLDDRFLVLPNGRAFQTKDGDLQWFYRMYLAAAKRWKIDTGDNSADAMFYQSDTKQLTVDWGSGTLIIDTPRSQGFSGFMGWRPTNATANLNCTIDSPYGNVLITSADGKDLGESHRLLLVATGRTENTGEEMAENKDGVMAITKVGKAPLFLEALRGHVAFSSNLASTLTVYALDQEGRRLGKVDSTVKDNRLDFTLSPKWGTGWFEISTPEIAGPGTPLAVGQTWPGEEKPRVNPPQAPAMIGLGDFWKKANGPRAIDLVTTAAVPQDKGARFIGKDFADGKPAVPYKNAKVSLVTDPATGPVLDAQFGCQEKDYFGGFFAMLTAPPDIGPGECTGFGFTFKGGGSMPREGFLTVKAGDVAYKSKPLASIFENDQWQDVLLSADDFTLQQPDKHPGAPAHPDWSKVDRVDFGCVATPLTQASSGQFGPFFFLMKSEATSGSRPTDKAQTEDAIHVPLPSPQVPPMGKIEIPYFPDATIKADGTLAEPEWKKSYGLTMDEGHVPAWNFFGSHVVSGHRANGEGANFWLYATKAGLVVMVEIQKGQPDVVPGSGGQWYNGDCVEVFTDPEGKGGKPAKQIFLAYAQPGLDRPGVNGGDAEIGRAKLTKGYVLETLLPWGTLGFTGVPTGEFGLEFQIDFAAAGLGRQLQMTYGTGTNDAWVRSDHYLKVQLKP